MHVQFQSKMFRVTVYILIFGIQCFSTLQIQRDVEKTFNKDHRRIVRSPQLFSGRNVLSDLTQFKPPTTLNDLNEFKEKMTTLLNLTSVFEQAIAAEKKARGTLQSLVNAVKEQITGVQRAVNPDPENYWTETNTCGGLVVSQTGRISYKPNEFYDNGERCIWTIRANHRSKIKLTLTKSDMEEIYDYVAVTEIQINEANTGIEWHTRRLVPSQPTLFEGPMIFVSFVSDASVRRRGFQLDFEGMGSNIHATTFYQHFHFVDWAGQFDSGNFSDSLSTVSEKDQSHIIASILINPSSWNSSKLVLSITDVLDLCPPECSQTKLAILVDFFLFSQGNSSGCCGESCEVNNFETTSGAVLVILKSSSWTNESHFQLNWLTETSGKEINSVDECGGILRDDAGKISYKENSAYSNNERCVWILQAGVNQEAEMKLQLLNEGFEQYYDYVTLSFFSQNDENAILKTKFLYKSGAPVQITSSIVIVEFYSDAATFGKSRGFDLIWEFKPINNKPVNVEVTLASDKNGSQLLACSPQNKENNGDEILVINAHCKTNSNLLSLHSEDLTSSKELLLFGGERGNFSRLDGSGDGSSDCILVILRKCFTTSKEIPVSWKTVEISDTGENADAQEFVKSDDKCGEILFGDSGRITYKLGKEYDINERCTWIIRAKTLSTVTVQLMADGFESCCDGVQINKIDTISGIINPEQIVISRENRFHSMDASAILVTFYSDHSVSGTGFVLEFRTKGDSIPNENGIIKHSQTKLNSTPTRENPLEPIFIPVPENSLSIDSFAIQNTETEVTNITAEVEFNNLEIHECNQDSVTLYHMPAIGRYELMKKIPSETLCSIERIAGENPLSSLVSLSVDSSKFYPKGGLLVIVTKTSSKADSDKGFLLKLK